MSNYGPAFWGTVIWIDETTVHQMPQRKELKIRKHSSEISNLDTINSQIHSGEFLVIFGAVSPNWV